MKLLQTIGEDKFKNPASLRNQFSSERLLIQFFHNNPNKLYFNTSKLKYNMLMLIMWLLCNYMSNDSIKNTPLLPHNASSEVLP